MPPRKPRCTTVTVRRERWLFYCHQIERSALFFIQLLQQLFVKLNNNVMWKTPSEVRKLSLAMKYDGVKSDSVMYNHFYNTVTQKMQHFPKLLQIAATAKIDLLEFEDHMCVKTREGEFIHQPIHSLYEFLLQLIYETPAMLVDDNADGKMVVLMKSELIKFVTVSIQLNYADITLSSISTNACPASSVPSVPSTPPPPAPVLPKPIQVPI